MSAREIKRLFKNGKKVRGQYIAARYMNTGEKKIGVGASSNIKTKPRRNKIRRRLKELFRLNWEILPDYHIFVVGQSSAAEVEWEKLKKDFLELVQKMKS